MTSSASSDNGSGTIDHTLGEKSNSSLRPIWEYDWKTESVRRMPRAPLLIAWYGIVFAAGCYPIVLSILVFACWRPDLGFSTYAEMIIAVPCGLVIGFSLAMIYGIVMSIPAYLLLKFFGWILKAPISSRAMSGIYGGLTGFMCVTGGGLFLAITELPPGDDLEGLYFSIFTVVLAVVVGHLGAVWAGYRYRNQGFPFFDSIIPTNQKITIGFFDETNSRCRGGRYDVQSNRIGGCVRRNYLDRVLCGATYLAVLRPFVHALAGVAKTSWR